MEKADDEERGKPFNRLEYQTNEFNVVEMVWIQKITRGEILSFKDIIDIETECSPDLDEDFKVELLVFDDVEEEEEEEDDDDDDDDDEVDDE